MPDIAKLINNLNPDPKKAGGLLVALNALGMIFAAASNTVAAAVDKNTSKKDKKFLVPAGAVTGIANIGIYYAMTKKIIKKLENSAETAVGKMSSEELQKNTLAFVNKRIAKAQKGLFKKSPEYLESMKSTFFNKNGELTKDAFETFKQSTKGGAGVLGAFVGAVVGCSILTPIIRDVSAYFVQKQMEKRNPEMSKERYMPYFDPAHLKPSMYGNANKKPLTMKNYMAFTNGTMKI